MASLELNAQGLIHLLVQAIKRALIWWGRKRIEVLLLADGF